MSKVKVSKVKTPSNDEILEMVQAYSKENDVEVFSDIDAEGEGMIVNIDNGFVEHFEEKYPGINLDETMSHFFEVLIKGFMQEIKDDPVVLDQIKKNEEAKESA